MSLNLNMSVRLALNLAYVDALEVCETQEQMDELHGWLGCTVVEMMEWVEEERQAERNERRALVGLAGRVG